MEERDGLRDRNGQVIGTAAERRLHDRSPFTHAVHYEVLGEKTDGDNGKYSATTVDISMNGIGIRTNAPLEPGRIIRLKNHRESIRGLVRWIGSGDRPACTRAGLEFM
jgi:PilZ domain-containing protein